MPDIDLGCLLSLSYFRILSERIDTLYIILCVLWLWYDTSTVPGGGGEGVLPIMAHTGRLRPKGVLFFRLQIYERVGISLAELYERVRKSHFRL